MKVMKPTLHDAVETAKAAAMLGDGRDQNKTYDKGWFDCAMWIASRLEILEKAAE